MKASVYHLTLVLILLLIGLSIYGAFIGAERAQHFFNSLPLAVYWIVTAIVIILSVLSFRRLRRPSLLVTHAGVVLVLFGSMAASEKGHQLSQMMTDNEKPVDGLMIINEGQSVNELYQRSTNRVFQLPYDVRLNNFVVETYAPYLMIQGPGDRMTKMPAETGAELTLTDMGTTIRVVKVFENFRITFEKGQSKAVDSEQPGRNPAVELSITGPDGTVIRQFVFELLQGHDFPDDNLRFSYYRPIKDYISKVDILRNGVVVKSAAIEVNHPLHYGGFHFYQYSYDDKQHQYTILKAVSDTGLYVVYAGYGLLCIGVIWYFWFIGLRQR